VTVEEAIRAALTDNSSPALVETLLSQFCAATASWANAACRGWPPRKVHEAQERRRMETW
jgi:hypothetical protein